ncbi:MAG: hypothetical protein ACYSW8_28660 [Planctomycetota bacterium]|jgi:hypothetical protein
MAFDYSTIKTGDGVDVSTEADFSNPVAGTVTKVESDCAFVKVLGTSDAPLEFCWHLDDPRLAGGPERFNQQQAILTDNGRVPPRTGVFRKSRTQSVIEELPERMANLERLVAEMATDVADLRSARSAEKNAQPVRRPRGRPRKPTAEPVGAS